MICFSWKSLENFTLISWVAPFGSRYFISSRARHYFSHMQAGSGFSWTINLESFPSGCRFGIHGWFINNPNMTWKRFLSFPLIFLCYRVSEPFSSTKKIMKHAQNITWQSQISFSLYLFKLLETNRMNILTNFKPMFNFYTLWKCQKTRGNIRNGALTCIGITYFSCLLNVFLSRLFSNSKSIFIISSQLVYFPD